MSSPYRDGKNDGKRGSARRVYDSSVDQSAYDAGYDWKKREREAERYERAEQEAVVILEHEVAWYRNVIAEELGYDGPPGDAVCPLRGCLQELKTLRQQAAAPIPMLLVCPACGEQHVDREQPDEQWFNPPHRTHQCQTCLHEWRPAAVPTVGVKELP